MMTGAMVRHFDKANRAAGNADRARKTRRRRYWMRQAMSEGRKYWIAHFNQQEADDGKQ